MNTRVAVDSRARLAKHVAKELLFFFFLYCGFVQIRDAILSLLGRSRAVVVYFHRIGHRGVLSREVDQFRDDIKYFSRKYACIGLRELMDRIANGRPLRRRSLVITFDDGYRDNRTAAIPILIDARVSATFFVSTGFIGSDLEFPHDLPQAACESAGERRNEKLSWDDLRFIEAAGFEVGSHTVTHANLGLCDTNTIDAELRQSLDRLNRELGERRRPLSFPWGKPENICEYAVEAARLAGYYSASSAFGGANSRGTDPFRIRRIDVGNGELSRLAIRAKVAGFDPDYFRMLLRKARPLRSSSPGEN